MIKCNVFFCIYDSVTKGKNRGWYLSTFTTNVDKLSLKTGVKK
jgi:hypothetical protein